VKGRLTSVIGLALSLCLRAGAVSAAGEHGHFFVFAAPGAATSETRAVITGIQNPAGTTLVHVGGGGEAALGVWGIGTDLGGLTRTRGAGTVTNISLNAFFHPFGQRQQRLDPYAGLGSSWFVRDSSHHALNAANVAGGLNYWLRGSQAFRLGLKLEVRGYLRGGRERLRYQEVRVGVCLSQ
jgi:hypothetical protein